MITIFHRKNNVSKRKRPKITKMYRNFFGRYTNKGTVSD